MTNRRRLLYAILALLVVAGSAALLSHFKSSRADSGKVSGGGFPQEAVGDVSRDQPLAGTLAPASAARGGSGGAPSGGLPGGESGSGSAADSFASPSGEPVDVARPAGAPDPAASRGGKVASEPEDATPVPPAVVLPFDPPLVNVAEVLADADLADPGHRARVVAELTSRETARREVLHAKATRLGVPLRVDRLGGVRELYGFRGDSPVYRTTFNSNAGISSGANLLRVAPYVLSGASVKVGVWDSGLALNTHQEFGSRVTIRNPGSPLGFDDHATHVSGTVIAAGTDARAIGMAPSASVDSYDWENDFAEMTAAGASRADEPGKIGVSNHSYGIVADVEDMGRYSEFARDADAVSAQLPYYLQFWAAGNEQDEFPVLNGYQSIAHAQVAKNIVTVGAVNDAVRGGVRDPSAGTMSSFSSWGPSDDGRIKPDIVANGVQVFSPISTGNQDYDTYDGTSMASPSAAGSAALLVELYAKEYSGALMRASLLKGLLIHTADDLGRPGPDYQYGWGLINVKAAADLIRAHRADEDAPQFYENQLTASEKVRTHLVEWDGRSPLRATLCWTDPAGNEQSAPDSRAANLVHDLDMRITAPDRTTVYEPYTMPFVGQWTEESMSAPAVPGDNKTDTVEQIELATPTQAGVYRITVSIKGNLAAPAGSQFYSLVVTGGLKASDAVLEVDPRRLRGFRTVPSEASDHLAFTVSGSKLKGAVTIAAPDHFELSSDGVLYVPLLNLALSGNGENNFPHRTIRVRVKKGAPVGAVAGEVVVRSADAVTRRVAVTGKVAATDGSAESFAQNVLENLVLLEADDDAEAYNRETQRGARFLQMLREEGIADEPAKAQTVLRMMGYDAKRGMFDHAADFSRVVGAVYGAYARLGLTPDHPGYPGDPRIADLISLTRSDARPLPVPAVYSGIAGAPWGASHGLAAAMQAIFASAQFRDRYPTVLALGTEGYRFYDWLRFTMFAGRYEGASGHTVIPELMNHREMQAAGSGQGAAAALRSIYVSVVMWRGNDSAGSALEKAMQSRLFHAILLHKSRGTWLFGSTTADFSIQSVLPLLDTPQIAGDMVMELTVGQVFPERRIAVDGYATFYAVRELPSWLQVDRVSGRVTASTVGGLVPDAAVGSHTLTLVAGNLAGETTAKLNLKVAAVSPAMRWLRTQGIQDGSNDAMGRDHDNDGFPAATEYAFGLRPTKADATAISMRVSGGYLSLDWTALKVGAAYVVEYADDLDGVWRPVPNLSKPLVLGDVGQDHQRQRVSMILTSNQRFYRVRAEMDEGVLK